MEQKELDLAKILEDHKIWLKTNGKKGKRANLQGASLQWANLQGANLQGASLQRANLQVANLQGASLQRANLQGANLQGANLPDFQICPEEGDFIEIEYSLASEEGKDKKEDAFILGEGKFFPGLEKELIGAKQGEEKQGLKIKNNEEKEFLVDVRVKSVKAMEIPELNDEFVKSLGDFNNLESLKENIKKGLIEEKVFTEKQKTREEILEKIVMSSNFKAPGDLVKREQEIMLENLKKRVSAELKISFEEYLKKIEKDEEALKESLAPIAEKKIKNNLVLREIKKKENIEASEEEINNQVSQILKHYHDPKDVKINPEELREYAAEAVVNEKAFEVLESCLKR